MMKRNFMTTHICSSQTAFYHELQQRFLALLQEHSLLGEQVSLSAKMLSPEEAIGIPKRKDFPILSGKDIMVQAECAGCLGQAFTDAPAVFHGTLEEICALDLIHSSHNRGIFIASLNAVMKHLGLVECTVHCKNDTPELCADDALHYIRSHYGNPKIALIGYQPALLEHLSAAFRLRAVDLNPEHIGQTRHEILIEDGNSNAVQQELCSWADLILCTGSTVCNGTIINYLPLRSKILFYGTSLAGAAKLMDLPRLCFADRYQ